MKNNFFEVNFDGLVGPSHHYAGLSHGNIASISNAMNAANPKAAALQGLKKMKTLSDMGFKQAVLPPHLRPNTDILKRLGFKGDNLIEYAWNHAPDITSKCFSASAMWTANAATVSPSPDTSDARVHFTPANLCRMFHRSYESDFTEKVLQRIFSDARHFNVHQALPSGHHFGDEGAANHTRLAPSHADKALELFVYGEQSFNTNSPRPQKYPARQSLEASQAIARLHGLDPTATLFAQQNPDVIDAGVFHNDVIAVGTTNLLFFHEYAFLNSDALIQDIQRFFGDAPFHPIQVSNNDVPLQDAIDTYLFNTQLLDISDNGSAKFIIIAPTECENNPRVKNYLDSLVASDSPIEKVHYFDLRESMKNGGGPACLRLRVALNQTQINALGARVIMDDTLYAELCTWVKTHYREQLNFDDLKDPALAKEIQLALSELETILNMPNIYGLA